MHMNLIFKTFKSGPKKLNHIFNNDKYYCLFLIYTKQISPSWGVYRSLDCQICTLSSIIVTKIKQDFLMKKERVKGFFLFMTMLSLKQAESNNGNKESCEQGCSWTIKVSSCLNF